MRIPAKQPFAYFRWTTGTRGQILSTGNKDWTPFVAALYDHAVSIFGPAMPGTRAIGTRTAGYSWLKIGFNEFVYDWPIQQGDDEKLTELHRWWSDHWGDDVKPLRASSEKR